MDMIVEKPPVIMDGSGPTIEPRRSRWSERLHVSAINRRRWANFKSNKRGYYSLILFLIMFFVSLLTDFIYTLVDPRIDFESREV